MNKFLLACLVFITFGQLNAQDANTARITGTVRDALTDSLVELVDVFVKDTKYATATAANGRYSLEVPANKSFELVFARVAYQRSSVTVRPMPAGSSKQVDVKLAPTESGLEFVVKESRIETGGMIREGVEAFKILPSTTGNLESILPSIALGTTSGTGGELSSQYNVRGGNYDENLVYVNDFEIYRPQLVRAGQQEGLSFPNIDLMRDLSFSSGGFESRYGDRLSSVLDIKYKRPDTLKTSLSISLLGGTTHLEGSFKTGKDNFRKLRYLIGARYKTNSYLLSSLDVKGEYLPNFADVQTYITYDITRDLQVGFLGNYNLADYRFVPESGSSGFGLINFALQLYTEFEGQEKDRFITSMGGVSLTYLPEKKRNPLFLKLMASRFRSDENETFDIIGDYSLRQIESDFGSGEFGKPLAELGTGTQHQYVRNFLNINLLNLEHRGGVELQKTYLGDEKSSSHFLTWQLKYQREDIFDRINEWERLDSAGYSLPYDPTQVLLFSVLKTQNTLVSNRVNGFFQDTYTFRNNNKGEWRISAGVRATYWDLNQEMLISPRAQILYKPLAGNTDISYRLAAGLYVQPPFYREMRGPDGQVNTDLKAQKSLHLVGGLTYDFYMGRNPKKFKFITEAYYKSLWDLVSYEIENVRIRYSGQNDSEGYVTGIDMRINGEFVPGAESWINLSFLRARERLLGVQHLTREIGATEATEVPDVPRPTDRFFNMSMFFQDYLPRNENFRMHLNFTVGTGLPFGLRGNNVVYRNTYRFNPYNRVDIGFSLALWDRNTMKYKKPDSFFKFTRNAWVSLEVFNLLDVQNQAGNNWIKTVFQQQYAIPTYLTSRRLNLRFRVDI
jgi:hypothetical protein